MPSVNTWRAVIAQSGEFRVTSNSMVPTLLPGDIAHVTPLRRSLSAGDIGVYVRDGQLIVHRYLGRAGFRGDNRANLDPAVAADAIVGRVRSFKRAGRRHRIPVLLPRLACMLRPVKAMYDGARSTRCGSAGYG
ncbi:MAG TPA: hypothetical protein DCR55_08150 [Lentisphaeria bacterium]|nr:hypothetical protein [Lentisphaeria bacterium]